MSAGVEPADRIFSKVRAAKKKPETDLGIRRSARAVAAAGLLTIIAFVAMQLHSGGDQKRFTPAGDGELSSAMLSLELAVDGPEVAAILGPVGNGRGQTLRQALDRANRVDFLFMVGYSLLTGFIFGFQSVLNRSRHRRFFDRGELVAFGVFLAIAMLAGDMVETITFFQLTSAPDPSLIAAETMQVLFIATRIKWAALFVASLLLGLSLASYFGLEFGLIGALFYTIAGFLGLFALAIDGARPLLSPASALLALGWLFSITQAGVLLLRIRRRGRVAAC